MTQLACILQAQRDYVAQGSDRFANAPAHVCADEIVTHTARRHDGAVRPPSCRICGAKAF